MTVVSRPQDSFSYPAPPSTKAPVDPHTHGTASRPQPFIPTSRVVGRPTGVGACRGGSGSLRAGIESPYPTTLVPQVRTSPTKVSHS